MAGDGNGRKSSELAQAAPHYHVIAGAYGSGFSRPAAKP